jgi:hypothetical protein
MSAQFHYLRDGKQVGPVSAEQLKQAAVSGVLRPQDLVWGEGLPDWVPASRVKGLAPAFAVPPPPAPPRRAPVAKIVAAQPEEEGAAALPVEGRSFPWGIVAGVATVGLAGLAGVALLAVALLRPAGRDRRAERNDAKAPPPAETRTGGGKSTEGGKDAAGDGARENEPEKDAEKSPGDGKVPAGKSGQPGKLPEEPTGREAPKGKPSEAGGEAPKGKPADAGRLELARRRMEAARAELLKWQKLKDFEDEQRSRALRMRIQPPPFNRQLSMNFNGAWVNYQRARKEHEALGGDTRDGGASGGGTPPRMTPAPKGKGSFRSKGAPPPSEVRAPARPAPPPLGGEWVQLFNGMDLTGWKPVPEGKTRWEVKEGVLVGSGPQGHLYTEKDDYQDFDLLAEARINHGGNSGIYLHCRPGRGFPLGYEAQINSTHADPVKTGSLHWAFDRSLSAQQQADITVREMLAKPGEWFTLEAMMRGNRIVLKVNGKTTVDFTDEKTLYPRGEFALQQLHAASVVEFRKIAVKTGD